MGREISSTDTHGTTTKTEYDPFGRIIKVTVTQGNITDVVTKEYDPNGTLVKETEEDGTIYTYTYDNMNRVVKEGIQKGELSKTWTTEYSYGSVQIHNGVDFEKVENVLITKEKNPDGELLEATYTDTMGRTLRQKAGGIYTDYRYDREGHVTAKSELGTDTENSKPIVTIYLYDKNGNATHQILNPGYDAEAKVFLAGKDALTQSMTYDSTGNVLSATDGEGNTTSYTYDANGRITKASLPTDKDGTVPAVSYQYDVRNGDGTTSDILTDVMGRTSVTKYNASMQPVEIMDKGDGTVAPIKTSYAYNGKGLLAKETDSIGAARTYEYDGKDRIQTVHYLNDSGKETMRTSYTYDKADNIKTMRDYKVSGTTATLYRYTGFTYDRLKRLSTLTEINTTKEPTEAELAERTTTYSYDIDNNLLSVTYPKADGNVKTLKYNYDKNKWLTKITAVLKDGTEAELRNYTYDKYGDVKEIKDFRSISKEGTLAQNPEYTTCTYSYDQYRRPVSMTYTDSESPDDVKEAYTYSYDKNSRIVQESIQNLYPEAEEDRQKEIRDYEYDTYGRLTKMAVDNILHVSESYDVSYAYDKAGNRLSQTKAMASDTETTNYRYNSLNQLLSSDTKNADGTVTEQKSYVYDAAGNQVKVTDSVQKIVTENQYDEAGRLAGCKKTENGKVTLQQTNQYNGAGARIQKAEGGKVTNYYYSQGGVSYTEDASGKMTSQNLHGISGNIIATFREKGCYYYHKDMAGSVTNLRDADGKSVVSYQYTDFGETSIHGDTDFYNEICYNESIYDRSTGLYYLNARYYNPEDGRFISRDSYRGNPSNPSTLHLYAYCANNPVNLEDPSGHIAISRIVGGIVGGAIGAFAGVKIAKKAKLKGWKKIAVIAGCTIGGAVIGAIAGPKVVKVAKKAARYVKRKLPSKSKALKATKKVLKKAKSGATKKISRARKAIPRGKTAKVTKTVLKKKAKKILVNGTTEGGMNKLSGGSFKDGFKKGVVKGGISEVVSGPKGAALGGVAVSLWDSVEKKESKHVAIKKAVASGFLQWGPAKISTQLGVSQEIDQLLDSDSLADQTAGFIGKWTGQVWGAGIDTTFSISKSIYHNYID